jgi:hypothetical protein
VEEGEKKVFIANHFFQLFRSSRIEEGNTQQLFDAVQPRITADMNAFLLTEFSEEEVKSALDSIGDFKAQTKKGNVILLEKYPERPRSDEIGNDLEGGSW